MGVVDYAHSSSSDSSSTTFGFNSGWISGMFFLMKSSCSALSQSSRFLVSVITFPAAENKRSESTLVHGADRYLRASRDSSP